MPTYEYECTSCGQHIEVFQRFSEDALTTCGVCNGPIRKVFHPVGIVFKGSGFYATDSRSGSRSATKKEGERSKGATSDAASSASSSEGGSKGSAAEGGSSSAAKDGSKGSASKEPSAS